MVHKVIGVEPQLKRMVARGGLIGEADWTASNARPPVGQSAQRHSMRLHVYRELTFSGQLKKNSQADSSQSNHRHADFQYAAQLLGEVL